MPKRGSSSLSTTTSTTRRPGVRRRAAAAAAAAVLTANSRAMDSLSAESSSVNSSLSNSRQPPLRRNLRFSKKKRQQKQSGAAASVASSLASSSAFAAITSSDDSCQAVSPVKQLTGKKSQRRKAAPSTSEALPPPILTAADRQQVAVPSSTPMPTRRTRRAASNYNLRSQQSQQHERQESLSPPCLEACDEAVNHLSSSKNNESVATNALLRAAIVALSPLSPVAVLAASASSELKHSNGAAASAASARNSQQSVATSATSATNSSQQDMARKLKRVAKRRIEVDAGVAAAIANRQQEERDNNSTNSSSQHDASGVHLETGLSPSKRCPKLPVNASANVALEDDEKLLDQSLEQSYWRLYQQCEYRDCVLRLCRQSDCVRWEDVLSQEMLDGLHKVGEGVYGEVYATRRGRQEVALKLFPIEGGQLVNCEPQKMFDEVLPELLISRKLTNLAYRYRSNKTGNFVQLLNASIVRGKLHPRLSEEWEAFNAGVRVSDNENPEFLPARQQWLLLEYKFAGCPLPAFRFGCYREARSVILQLALSLAAAESQFQFEHRDLHWNNVLVRRSGRVKIRYRVADHNYAINCEGLEVAIIDFTVSRVSPAPGYVLYIDMSGDEGIFVGDGDYQFEVYRMMRRDCSDDWRKFNPRTNLMWLHYLLDKLLTSTVFPRRDPDSLAVQSELAALHDCLLSYDSCQQLVRENFYFLENAMDNDAAGLN
ncbi:hypothetical protein BOX15_Mlig015665g1 [Macrostomum lignano]|uniref:Uncharacterized protein n=2 Tax=Macrostomum lignano TaxID=282301 RepID=A0A267FG23_9PLAT|nr:hypothetical protein BOX15_Mlig015665g1 [Macrostomum lignano]